MELITEVVGKELNIGDLIILKSNYACKPSEIFGSTIIDMDDHSFAIQDGWLCKWWFYKDSLQPYGWDADILGVVVFKNKNGDEKSNS